MVSRRLRSRSPRLLLRLALLAVALPCVYWGGAGAAYFARYRAANAPELVAPRLTPAVRPNAHTRLMVFAPHCDDETLGCGGLMQRVRGQGGSVRAVIMTNGDAYRTAVERQVRSMQVGPSDYIAFANLRQTESYRALSAVGLTPNDVTFLGYPDRGLMPLWSNYWTPDKPYTSVATRRTRSPYANTFDRNAVYCGQDLLADIEANLRAFRPTLVTVTHPAEDHTDHAAAAAFVARALDELRSDPREAGWAKRCRLEYYLVHRGDWPVPQGTHTAAPLLPPASMTEADTHWTNLPLTRQEIAQKTEAINRYPSQTALMGGFLYAFARSSELLGDLPDATLTDVPNGAMQVTSGPLAWETIAPVLRDPVRDNLLRDLQPAGDIRALYACRDSQNLYIRLETRQPVSSHFRYALHLRVFGLHGETSETERTYLLSPDTDNGPTDAREKMTAANIVTHAQGRTIQAAIPIDRLQVGAVLPASLALSADTHLAGVEVDKTGIRLVKWQ